VQFSAWLAATNYRQITFGRKICKWNGDRQNVSEVLAVQLDNQCHRYMSTVTMHHTVDPYSSPFVPCSVLLLLPIRDKRFLASDIAVRESAFINP